MIKAKAESLSDRLQRHIDFIDEALIQLANGILPDMKPLDDVMPLCTALQKKPETIPEIAPLSAELIGRLERLAMAIEEYKDTLKT